MKDYLSCFDLKSGHTSLVQTLRSPEAGCAQLLDQFMGKQKNIKTTQNKNKIVDLVSDFIYLVSEQKWMMIMKCSVFVY